MKKAEKPLAERIVEVLGARGPLNLDELAKHADTTKATLYTMIGTLQKKHGVVRVERGVYGLRAAIKDGPPKPRPTPAPRRINGNGHDIYAEALTGLQEKRAVLVDELAKVDRAIEAVGALA